MKKWFNRLSGAVFSLFILTSASVFAASPDFSSLGAVSDNAFDTAQARDGDTVTFTLTINVAEDSDGTGQVTFDVGAATGLTATFPAAAAATTHTATYAVPAGQDGAISVTDISFTNTGAETLINEPAYPHTPTPNVTLDNTDPTVTSITRQNPATSPTSADSVTWRILFGEPADVSTVDVTDFTITGTTATLGVTQVDDDEYDVTASGGDLASLNATVTLNFSGGQNIADIAGNSLTVTTPTGTDDNDYVVDNTAPTVTENTAVVTPANDTTPDVIINTNEAGTLLVGGSCGSASEGAIGSGSTTITLTQSDNSTALAAGTYADCTVQITDASGNANAATSLTSFVVDLTQPDVVSIVRQTPASSPTSADSLALRVTFSEDVQNVDTADFSVQGTTTATVTNVAVQTANTVFDVTISGGDLASFNGTAGLAVAGANNITDLASNTLSSTTPTGADENYLVDNTAPTVTENTAVSTPTMDTTPDVIINTDEAGTLTMGGSCGTSSSTTLGSGNTTITLTQSDNSTPLAGGATYSDCTVQVTDASGNANVATTLTSFDVDDGAPTVDSIVRNTPATTPTNADSLVWRVTFSEDVQNVDATDFSVTNTTATLGVATVSANTYDVTAGGGDLATLNNTVTLSFDGAQNVQDLAANALIATTPTGANDNDYVVDNTAPTVTENTAVTDPTGDSTPDVIINSDEAGTLTMGGSCGTSSSTALASGNTTIVLTQADNTTALASGTYSDCTVQITDASGNANVATALTSFEVDTIAPVISEITAVPNPTTDNTPDYTFTTDEAGTISYGGACSSATTAAVIGNNTVTFNTLADATHSNCTITVTDGVGNPSTVLNIPAFRVDTLAPSVQSATVATSGNPGFARATQTVTFNVNFNEAVTVTAVNAVSNGTNVSTVTTEFDVVGNAEDALVFTVQAGENGLVTPVVNFDIQDAAGLTSTITSLGTITGTPIVADTTAPTLAPVSIASNNADTTLAATGDNVIVSFTGSETLTAVSGTIFTELAAPANPAGDDWTLTLMTSGDETEGLAPFTADFSDEAGNMGTQVVAVTDGSSVTYDNSPAAVSSVFISSTNTYSADAPVSYARSGQAINVTILATEDIQQPTGTILGLTPTSVLGSGNLWVATLVTTGGHGEGVVPFSLDIQDLAGSPSVNVSATTNGSSVIYDETAPLNPTTTLDAEGVTTGTPKSIASAVFNWTGDTDVTAGVAEFVARFENTTTAINESVTVTLPSRTFTPSSVISSTDPYNLYITTRDKAGNESAEVLVYTQEYAGSLKGTVTDQNTGLPLAGVVVNVIAKYGEYCSGTNEVCTGTTDTDGNYEVNINPNQEYVIDFVKLPSYQINKKSFSAGVTNLIANAQMSNVENGTTQTGDQRVVYNIKKGGEEAQINVFSFSGTVKAKQVSGGIEFTSFGRIVSTTSNKEGIEPVNQGNNVWFLAGASLIGQGVATESVKQIVGSSSGGGFSGMTRAQNATKGRVLTPAESMAFIKEMNNGSEGQTLYYTNHGGKKVFAGYVKGRLAMVVFAKNSKTPVVYRGYRRTRQGYDGDQASVNANQVAINNAINKNKMLKKQKFKSVATSNRYESMRRKMAMEGKTMTPLINRRDSTARTANMVKYRNNMVANKEYKFARSNGFTQTESRIAKNRKANESARLKVIKSTKGVASILKQIKAEQLQASVIATSEVVSK